MNETPIERNRSSFASCIFLASLSSPVLVTCPNHHKLQLWYKFKTDNCLLHTLRCKFQIIYFQKHWRILLSSFIHCFLWLPHLCKILIRTSSCTTKYEQNSHRTKQKLKLRKWKSMHYENTTEIMNQKKQYSRFKFRLI